MTDLFTSHLSKRDRLKIWLKEKGFAKTSEVIKFSSSIYSNRGDRDARQLAEEGFIRRLTDKEKIFRGFNNTKEDVWAYIDK